MLFTELLNLPVRTKMAGLLFIIAFFLKFLLLTIAFIPSLHWLGYILFVVAFGCLIIAIVLCCMQMKSSEQPPSKTDVERWMKFYNLNKEA